MEGRSRGRQETGLTGGRALHVQNTPVLLSLPHPFTLYLQADEMANRLHKPDGLNSIPRTLSEPPPESPSTSTLTPHSHRGVTKGAESVETHCVTQLMGREKSISVYCSCKFLTCFDKRVRVSSNQVVIP